MNTNPFNTQVYNATPSISSANGISIVDFGTFTASMGSPVIVKFESTNYIVQTISNVNYVKSSYSATNYVKGS